MLTLKDLETYLIAKGGMEPGWDPVAVAIEMMETAQRLLDQLSRACARMSDHPPKR